MSMPAITEADRSSFGFNSTTELDIVKQIDKFLEDDLADGFEQSEHFNRTNNFNDNLKEDKNSLNNNEIEFVGKNSAVFHLLEDHEEFGIYEHIPNEINWNVFYKTLRPGEINYSIKQEPRNDDFASNDTTFSNNEMENSFFSSKNFQNPSIQPPKIKLEPFSTVDEQNQEDTLLEETPCTTLSISKLNEIENFSFLQSFNNIQADIIPKENSNEQFINTSTTLDIINSKTAMDNFSFSFNKINNFENPVVPRYIDNQKLNNVSKSKIKKWKQNKKYKNSNPRNKPLVCEYSKTPQNYGKDQWNRKTFDGRSKRKNNRFKNNFTNTFQFNPPESCSSSILPDYINNNSTFSSLIQPIKSKALFNQPIFKDFKHTDQQDSFLISNKQYSEICHDNKEKVICNSLEKEKNTNHNVSFVLHHIIKDYLCPASLVGSTVKFTSRKLANTCIRNELNVALNSYGTLENSWWTPDDMFFATFTSRSIAQHVYKIYPKNPTSSY